MSIFLTGSICLSKIPRSEMRKVVCKDGVERIFVNVAVFPRKEKSNYGDTHFITCAPPKDKQKEGVNYIFGDLKSTEFSAKGQQVTENDDLPF